MKNIYKNLWIVIGSFSLTLVTAKAQIVITEVDAAGSATSTYAQDWFELTNEGSSAVNISGWAMDDNSDSYSDAVSLTGISSIAAGQSVVFIEDTGDTLTNAQLGAEFEQAWFGSNVPTDLTLGYYGGKGVGLSQSGDGVNIFNSSGIQVTGVLFGASGGTVSNGATLDNSVLQLGGTQNNDPTISTFSVAGQDGAFESNTGDEIGSPGAVPEPSTNAMIVGGFCLLALAWRRRGIAGL